MDKLIEQALKENKIVRYIPTFVKVLETYKRLLEAENEQLHKPVVMQGLPSECLSKNKVCEYPINSCEHCKYVRSQTVGREREKPQDR